MSKHSKRAEFIKGLSLRGSQRGMASMIVATVLIAVIGLIIVGFSLTVRRNQKETLDRQLSTQAYYAAETAVDYAWAKAKAELASPAKTVTAQTNCADSRYNPGTLANGTKITCVTVDNSLPTLVYGSVTENENTIVPVISSDLSKTFSIIQFEWHSSQANPSNNCVAGPDLPPRGSWNCGYGILRADITNDFSGNNFASTLFFKPVAGVPSSAVAASVPANGVISVTCDNSLCRAVVAVPAANAYYVRLRSLYKDSAVDVQGKTAGGVIVETSGQILIDSTAKSQDVLRRIQVRVPTFQDGSNLPIAAIESSGAVCKRFAVAPGTFFGGPAADPLCAP